MSLASLLSDMHAVGSEEEKGMERAQQELRLYYEERVSFLWSASRL